MSDPKPNPSPAPASEPAKPSSITSAPSTPAAAATAVTATPPKPAPPKPAPPKPPAKGGKDRRFFLLDFILIPINLGWTTLTVSSVALLLGTVRFLFPNVLSEPPSKVKAGFPDQYEEGKVTDRLKDQNIWVVKHLGQIYALSTTCTHLGCTPQWLEREQKFKCPCHGSGFYITGVNFEGPAPRPLERWAISVGDDGQLVVDKSRKFQSERGEWTNPDSFIKL
jgi:cytochrome b6-f complex iron-sulfur subunit